MKHLGEKPCGRREVDSALHTLWGLISSLSKDLHKPLIFLKLSSNEAIPLPVASCGTPFTHVLSHELYTSPPGQLCQYINSPNEQFTSCHHLLEMCSQTLYWMNPGGLKRLGGAKTNILGLHASPFYPVSPSLFPFSSFLTLCSSLPSQSCEAGDSWEPGRLHIMKTTSLIICEMCKMWQISPTQ